jgi:hypothetical protein
MIEKLERVEDGTKESLRLLYSWDQDNSPMQPRERGRAVLQAPFSTGPMLDVDNESRFPHPRTSCLAVLAGPVWSAIEARSIDPLI